MAEHFVYTEGVRGSSPLAPTVTAGSTSSEVGPLCHVLTEKVCGMKWDEVRKLYPDRWLLIEAVHAHSDSAERMLDDLNVLEPFADSVAAMHHYAQLHHQTPQRELYVVHTSRESL